MPTSDLRGGKIAKKLMSPKMSKKKTKRKTLSIHTYMIKMVSFDKIIFKEQKNSTKKLFNAITMLCLVNKIKGS